MLTNQLAKAIRRFFSEVRCAEAVDLAGWGPFPAVRPDRRLRFARD